MIEHILSKHSSNDNLFNIVRKGHNDVLKLNGYEENMKSNTRILIKIYKHFSKNSKLTKLIIKNN